ncbi:hypothetical protein U1Q18_030445 [Sarracenia purpurea var. burkii]
MLHQRIAWATDNRSLKRTFSQYGDIIKSKIITDRETSKSRGFGFMTFKDEQSMKAVIEGMKGRILMGGISLSTKHNPVKVVVVAVAVDSTIAVVEKEAEVVVATATTIDAVVVVEIMVVVVTAVMTTMVPIILGEVEMVEARGN